MLRGIELESSGEYPEHPEHRTFVRCQQAIRPFDHGSQRSMTAVVPAATSGEESEPVDEPVDHGPQPERRNPRRGQLDRQRVPIELLAEAGHLVALVRAQRCTSGLDSGEEQL